MRGLSVASLGLLLPAKSALSEINFAQQSECNILSLLDFTGNGKDAYGHMASAQLATEHFNTRDPAIVPQLSDLGDCTVTLPDSWFRDSKNDVIASLSAFEELYHEQDRTICSLIGPQDERTLQVLSGVAELEQIPVVMNAPRTIRNDYPSIVGARFPMRYIARSVADYFEFLEPQRKFIVTLYDNEDFDGPFQERAEDELDSNVSGEWIVSVGESDSIEDAIEEILEEGYNTVLIDISSNDISLLEDVAEVANENGLFDLPIFWAIGSKVLPPSVFETMEYEVGSPMDLLLTGAAMHADYDPFMLHDKQNEFTESWRMQDSTLVNKINLLHPLQANDPSYFAGDADYFQTTDPPVYSSFIYDSIILTGISACQLQEKQKLNQTDLLPDVQGGPHLGEMLLSQFDGASGNFAYGSDESEEEDSEDEEDRRLDEDGDNENEGPDKNRSPDGFRLGMYNIRSEPSGDGKNRYYTILTAFYDESEWKLVEDEEFIYANGTPNPPLPTRVTFDYNYLDHSYFVAGMVLMSIALVIILCSFGWVVWKRNERIVQVAQPAFLYLLCFGSTMVAISLAFVSFDESFGYSQDTLSAFCMAFPWLFAIGYVIQYCALAGKLWRINKLMSNPLRRQKVRTIEAAWPFGILIGTLVTLICWQVIDPFVWKRVEIFDEPLETLGQCTSNNAVPYIATLGTLMGIATMLTLYASWQAKHVQKELSESKWIFAGIFSNVQMWAIGIPVYIIMYNDNASASYIIKVALAFLFSTTMVILVVWPKIYDLHFADQVRPGVRVNISDTSKHNVRISGIGDISKHNREVRLSDPSNVMDTSARVSGTHHSGGSSNLMDSSARLSALNGGSGLCSQDSGRLRQTKAEGQVTFADDQQKEASSGDDSPSPREEAPAMLDP